jgi:hypothetical protein
MKETLEKIAKRQLGIIKFIQDTHGLGPADQMFPALFTDTSISLSYAHPIIEVAPRLTKPGGWRNVKVPYGRTKGKALQELTEAELKDFAKFYREHADLNDPKFGERNKEMIAALDQAEASLSKVPVTRESLAKVTEKKEDDGSF